MAVSQDTSLEEILWRSPPHVQMMGGFLHSNNILFYFAESPFFDATSNNASLAIQASYNESFRHFVETREAFENRLRTMQGLEFVVAYDPLQAAAQSETSFAHEPSNVWVIRKQTRRKRSGMDDEVAVLATFFVVGDCIYMAPSVASIVGNRILSAVTSLTSMLKTASTLPTFTSSYGHTYMPPTTTTTKSIEPGQSQPSKEENTPMPEADSQTRTSTGQSLTGAGVSGAGSNVQDTRTLAESFNLLSRYGEEFMDENPLLGEPGSFILSRAGDVDRPAPAAAAAAPAAATTTKQVPSAAGGTTNASRVSTPQVKVDTPGKAGSATPISDEKKQRKSKIGS